MVYIADYWKQKETRAEKARKHTEEMGKLWRKFIDESIAKTVTYSTWFKCKKDLSDVDTHIVIEDMDSVSAILKYEKPGNKMAVLNFASYKNPGGMFLNGSSAQEESLCHESYLYNVLSECSDYYEWNNDHKFKALYANRALYSPNIVFSRPIVPRPKVTEDSKVNTVDWALCDVITCAAPNKSAAQKYGNVPDAINSNSLYSRIEFVLDIAKEQEVKTLILGAYGCGVFGQDPTEVASYFKTLLFSKYKCFDTVVFAIPNGNNGNLAAFKKVFNN